MAIPAGLYEVWRLRGFVGNAFEGLCRALLEYEVPIRYPASVLQGPGPEYTPDGGIDFLIERKDGRGLSIEQFGPSLTGDLPGDIAISCKTGQGVKTAVLRDAGKRKSKKIQEHLRSGGSYLVLTNSLGPLDIIDLREKLANKFAENLQWGADSLTDKIAVRGAGNIVSFLNTQPVNLSADILEQMGLSELADLKTLPGWRQELQSERGTPSFVSDPNRDSIIQAIYDMGTSQSRDAIWLHGAPGVGKSRVVLEALNNLPTDKNIFVTSDVDYGEKIVRHSLTQLPGMILIVDEYPPSRALGLRSSFIGSGSGERGLLVLIGPNPAPHEIGDFSFRRPLEPLNESRSIVLVAQTLGLFESDEIVQRIVYLTEGFPWFAVLVAKAVSSDHQTLMMDPTQLNAADLAIGGALANSPASDYASKAERDQVVSLRKKALMAAILLEGEDWSNLQDKEQQIAAVLEASWPEIWEQAVKSEERGILRTRLGWRYCYVTPNNLGRIVAEEMLRPPSSLSARIKREMPDLLTSFYRRLETLEVSPDILARLADAGLASPFDIIESARRGDLSFLAEQQPHATGHRIADYLARIDDAMLKSLNFPRMAIVAALSHISRRKGGFSIAEPSLFRLAMNEMDAYSNNATGIWVSLYDTIYAYTHEPFSNRFACLKDRVQSEASDEVMLALNALQHATGARGTGQGYSDKDRIDGEWPTQENEEIRKNRLTAWMLLIPLTRAQGEIGMKARQASVNCIRSMIHWNAGAEAIEEMANVASAWPSDGKTIAREAINNVKSYDQEYLRNQPELMQSIDLLSHAVAPGGHHDRLVDVTGYWDPGNKMVVGTEEREQYYRALEAPLVNEMLEQPHLLHDEIGWLESEAAVRSRSYMFHLGKVDEDRIMLPTIMAEIAAGQGYKILPPYLTGVAYGQGDTVVDGVLRGWRGMGKLAKVTLEVVQSLGASVERINWVVEDLSRGAISPDSLYILAFGGWGSNVDIDVLRPLLYAMARYDNATSSLVALKLVTDNRSGPMADEWILFGCDLAETIAHHFPLGLIWENIWTTGCEKLIQPGHALRIANATWTALKSGDEVLAISGDPLLWHLLDRAMEEAPSNALGLIDEMLDYVFSNPLPLSSDSSLGALLRRVSDERLAGWVGDDQRKGAAIARLVDLQQPELPSIAPLLLSRFGAESYFAQSLASEALSGSFSGRGSAFYKSRMANAEAWAKHENPEASRWAKNLINNRLKPSVEAMEAREEFEDRQLGR